MTEAPPVERRAGGGGVGVDAPAGLDAGLSAELSTKGPVRLVPRAVEKPWGRATPPPPFEMLSRRRANDPAPVGEVWFEWPGTLPPPPGDLPLLIKYLFTAEALSVQVHPDDAAARAVGLPRGKDEAWIVIEAAPGATLSLGPVAAMTPDAVRAGIAGGTLADALTRITPRPGDWFHVPPGTIHAIGGGLTLLEVQQTSDTTYRLYDYGRPRDLHVEEALACARLDPAPPPPVPVPLGDGVERLVDGAAFALIRWHGDAGLLAKAALPADTPLWFLPIAGAGAMGHGTDWRAGEAWWLPDARHLAGLDGAGRGAIAFARDSKE